MRVIRIAIACAAMCVLSPVLHAHAQTLDKIKTSGAVLVGYRTDAPPFSSGAGAEPQGFSIDLCNRVVVELKLALKMDNLQVKYVPVDAETRFSKLESGEIDIECGATTRTLSRETRFDFSLFTFLTGTEMLVRLDSNIRAPSDLAGKKIAVLPGTTTEKVMKDVLKQLLVNADIVPVKSHEDGIAAITDGRADGYASDQVLLIGLAKKSKDPSLYRMSGTFYSYEPYALMIRKNDADFRVVADRALAQTYKSGQIWEIYKRWFGEWNVKPGPALMALYALQSLSE
ncbi:MAG TPA: amino acid ABC transporter substrate-binding protein [Alphaproteobacteria bacterium]|nr:amino acid ABC transporter substrate-binding protein [Alphaproteobacteria bacterium]